MNVRTLILSAATAASALAAFAGAAVAQPYGLHDGPYDQPAYRQADRPPVVPAPPPAGPGPFGPGQFHDGLGQHEQGLQDWMQRGAEEGWLRGWPARRAFGTLANIRREEHDMRWRNGGFLRGDQKFRLNQQLDELARFVRSIHDGQGHRPW
jgi:hypothetical protein